MIDVLELLHAGQISLEQAYDLENEVMERFHRGEKVGWWVEELGLDKYEATARSHGASFVELAKFRYEGWPVVCSVCGREIDYRQFGWWFEHDQEGKAVLRHLTCPP